MFSRGTVKDAVASAWDMSSCPIDEATAKLAKAISETNGSCNNELALKLAINKESTVDDIIRLGSVRNSDGERVTAPEGMKAVFHRGHRKMTTWEKDNRFTEMRRVKLEDTVIGKYLKQNGLLEKARAMRLTEYSPSDVMRGGAFYREKRDLCMLMFIAKLDRKRLDEFCPALLSAWVERINVSAENDRMEAKKHMLEQEFKALNQAPSELLVNIENEYTLNSNRVPHTFSAAFWATWSGGNSVDYYSELGRMTFEALEYMGLGIYHNAKDYYTSLPSLVKKGTIPIAKKVLNIQKTFNQMLKQGFDPDIVRDEMVSQLEEYADSRSNNKWRFFKRLDASMTYEIAKKKKAKSTTQGKAKDTTPHTEVIEGVGEVQF